MNIPDVWQSRIQYSSAELLIFDLLTQVQHWMWCVISLHDTSTAITGVLLPAAAHAHAHAAAAAASAYDASKSAYYQQAAAAYPAAAPPQPQPTYDAAAAKPAYSTPATYAQVSHVQTVTK